MQKILLTLLILLSFSGCGENEKKALNDAKKAQEENTKLLQEIQAKDIALMAAREEAKAANEKLLIQEKAKKEAFIKTQEMKQKQAKKEAQNKKLSQIGISIDDSKISIDTNVTKDFFTNIGKMLETKLQKLSKDIEQGHIDDNNTGVKIDQDHINIDLNKTKDFLENWSKKMQGFVKDFNTLTNKIELEPKNKSEK